MTHNASGNGGWSLRKALVRRVAEAVNAYEEQVNRPAKGAEKSEPVTAGEPGSAEPAGLESGRSEADQG